MNCKPGDLAVYIGKQAEMLGMVMRCISINERGSLIAGEPVWDVDRRHSFGHNWVRDSSLRPLRDPGDDAQDETLNWLPVPTKEVA